MIFGSPILFCFSIIIAYLNPFFIEVELTTILFLIYVLLISGGAIATSLYLIFQKKNDRLATLVLLITFIGSMILACWVETYSTLEFNSVLLVMGLITAASTWVANYTRETKNVSLFLIVGSFGLLWTLLRTNIENSVMSALFLGIVLI